MNPAKWYINHEIVEPWHQFLTGLSSQLDILLAVAIAVLLFLRLFQWKVMGKAILPVIGVYALLKVILP